MQIDAKATKELLRHEVQDYIVIILGMILYGIGWTLFLLPNTITTGGVAGIASVVYYAIGLPVPYIYTGINAILLLLSIRILGFRFSLKTIMAVATLTIVTSIQSTLFQHVNIIPDQPFMACVIGAVLCGMGVGIAFSVGGSTGGTDIIAAIVNKYRDISLGRVMMMCDLIIITSSYLVLKDWEKVVFGYVELMIANYTLDWVVNSARQSVQFFIISNKYEEIGHAINLEVHRGVTVIDGKGFYTGKETKMLFILAKKRQSARIFHIIKAIDPNAFVSQSAVIGVYGNGFDHIKGK